MLSAHDTPPPPDASGVSVLVLLLRFHGIAADSKQLVHQYGETIGTVEILRCAKDLRLKARAIERTWQRLARTTLPAIVSAGIKRQQFRRFCSPRKPPLARTRYETL